MAPNILFLFTDQQRADTMSAYGNNIIQTPNLNRLADKSFIFDQAYVTQPVCTPSRASIMSGLYPHTCGCVANNIALPESVPCLPEILADGDTICSYMGKWHLGDEIFPQHGFPEWKASEDGYYRHHSEEKNPQSRSAYHSFLLENGFQPADGSRFSRTEAIRLPEEYGKPAFLAKEASRFIRENRNDPFVLYVNFLEPHDPKFGPRDFQYDPKDVILPESIDKFPADNHHLKNRIEQKIFEEDGGPFALALRKTPPDRLAKNPDADPEQLKREFNPIGYRYNGPDEHEPLREPDDWRYIIARYWGNCSLVDTHVGSILDTLEECGLDDNTIVVYTSDHGDMMGSHGLLEKCVMYEEAVKVPLLIRLPGQTESRRIMGPVGQVDLLPTLLDYMGKPCPSHLEGNSLRGAMDSGSASTDVFIEWNRDDRFFGDFIGQDNCPDYLKGLATQEEAIEAFADPIRTIITADGWKFNWSVRGDNELFNLKDDPQEIVNRAFDSDYESVVTNLKEKIRAWQARTSDEIDFKESV